MLESESFRGHRKPPVGLLQKSVSETKSRADPVHGETMIDRRECHMGQQGRNYVVSKMTNLVDKVVFDFPIFHRECLNQFPVDCLTLCLCIQYRQAVGSGADHIVSGYESIYRLDWVTESRLHHASCMGSSCDDLKRL